MGMEDRIQQACNELGAVATQKALEYFDTDGSPIVIGGIKWTAQRNRESKKYQTPYGEVSVDRHVYQASRGGKTYCPTE